MTTYSALTHTQGRQAAEALAEACEDLDPEPFGTGVFEIEDGSDRWEVGAYFTESPDDIALALLAAVHGANPFAISEVPDVDWVAHVRRELTPVRAGRFYVHGSHDADTVPEGVEALCIEAAGFGHQMLEDNAPFDLVLANILKQPLIDLAPQMAQMVAPEGRIILSGILTTQADEVLDIYAAQGFGLDRRDDLGDWSALTLTRRS